MKTPQEINFYPLDRKKDNENGGMWIYLPEWIVRAFRLKTYGHPMGTIKVIIKRDKRCMAEYFGEQEGMSTYYKNNWAKKLNRERRSKNKEEKDR